jgi:hypothetical protein
MLQEWSLPGFFSRDRIRHLIWWDKFVYVQDVRGLSLTQRYLWTFKSSRMQISALLGLLGPEGEGTMTLRSVKISLPVDTSCHRWRLLLLWNFLTVFRHAHKTTKKAIIIVMSVRPSARIEQLGPHWTEFHEIWYLSVFRKYVEEFQVSLISGKNKGYFTGRPIYICDHVSLSYS